MNNMPKKLREECARDPEYQTCMRNAVLHDHECMPNPMTGRMIEWEHAMIYAHNQMQKKWCIVSLCWWVHSGPDMVKEINIWLALSRATTKEILEISKARDYFRYLHYLNSKYGQYEQYKKESAFASTNGINYERVLTV